MATHGLYSTVAHARIRADADGHMQGTSHCLVLSLNAGEGPPPPQGERSATPSSLRGRAKGPREFESPGAENVSGTAKLLESSMAQRDKSDVDMRPMNETLRRLHKMPPKPHNKTDAKVKPESGASDAKDNTGHRPRRPR